MQYRLYSYQQWNAPQSIQARNKELLISQGKLRLPDESENVQPFKKSKKSSYQIENEMQSHEFYGIDEIDKNIRENENNDLQFKPQILQKQQTIASPIGKIHTRGAKFVSNFVKGSFHF